jgi:predicted DCC family thiol-disulfide oxidoreductase YuxK
VPAGPKRRPDQQSTLDGNDRLFVFDGECGFCTKWAGWLEHRVGAVARFLPFQALDDLGTFVLTIEDVRTASYLIESGTAYRGGRRFARAMARGRGTWRVIGRLLDMPGARRITAIVYQLIARNRRRLRAPHPDISA